MQWKQSLISQVDLYKDYKPTEFRYSEFDQKRDLFKKVFIFGAFQNDFEFLLSAKYLDDSEDKAKLGYHVITPFITTDGDVIFVNRGWIPEDLKDKEKRKDSQIVSLLETPLFGMVRESGGKAPWFMPQNMPEKDIWFWIELPEMIKKLQEKSDLQNIKPVLIQQIVPTALNDFKYPIPISGDIEFYNQHLTYVITWFSLAFVMLGMWWAWSRKK